MARTSAPARPGAIVVGGDFQGLGVLRSLSAHDIPVCVVDHEVSISRFSRCPHTFAKCPPVKDEAAFLAFLDDLVGDRGLEGWVVFPTNDETVRLLAQHRDDLSKRLRIPTPRWEVTRNLYDKRLTHELAARLSVAAPQTWYAKNLDELVSLPLPYPVIIKPAIKDRFYPESKAKAVLVEDSAALAREYRAAQSIIDADEIMVQEIIPGGPENLYSFCALFKEGKAAARLVGRRWRQHPMDFGHASTYVETVDVPELEEMGSAILSAIDYYGLAEVEFKRDPRDGTFKFLEVNARTWGWHTIGRRAGVDFPHILYKDMIGEGFSSNGFKPGVKWIRSLTDMPTVAKELLGGRMRASDYARSLRGEKESAVFSLRDPLPFFAEFALIPYLWKRRGF